MPLVSVVMTSYNYAEFLTEAIEGVLDQDVSDLELIIIDDCSTDRSPDLIKEFERKDSRIRAYFHDKNMGIPKTQNQGISLATGKFIAFCASDDIWLKDKLRRQLEIMKKDENLIVWGDGVIIDRDGNPTGQRFTQVYNSVNRKRSGDILEELLKGNFILSTSRMLKLENLKSIRFNEDLKYLNDWQFAVDLASRYHYYFIEEPLVKYRLHGRNTILREVEGVYWNEIDIRRYFLLAYSDRISNETKDVIYSTSVYLLKSRISQMSKKITEMSNAISELNQNISVRDSKISEMDHEISDMKRSILWHMAMKYHTGFVEQMMPHGTRRRKVYDLGLSGGRIIVNEGVVEFCRRTMAFAFKPPSKKEP